jgi:hypothetical protein
MTKPPDDLEAVRAVVDALSGFDAPAQERILRWAREKLGLHVSTQNVSQNSGVDIREGLQAPEASASPPSSRDIKSFIAQKKPASDNQFAAAVAYYYRFEAPPPQRKDTITADDLQEATRLVGRDRLRRPIGTLHDATRMGLLDRAGRGQFAINTVGENLVAMTLPQAGSGGPAPSAPPRKRPKRKRARTR